MVPVLTAAATREVDRSTLAQQGIGPLELMERAAEACTDHLLIAVLAGQRFLVCAGQGNNGGDGLAIARLLRRAGRDVQVVVVPHRNKPSEEQAANLELWRNEGGGVLPADLGSLGDVIADHEVVVDAILGAGVDRPLTGAIRDVVRLINERARHVVSIDLPSGLFAEDNTGNDLTVVVHADEVIALQTPKLALLLPENGIAVRSWCAVDIGLDAAAMAELCGHFMLTEAADVSGMLPVRSRFDHKGRFGHAWLLAGAVGKHGAAILSAQAAARSGCGLVTVHGPASLEVALNHALPEAMFSKGGDGHLDEWPRITKASAFGIGPGIGTAAGTANVLKRAIQEVQVPLVLDADALNILADNPTWLGFLPAHSILTPHPKEFDHLFGVSANGYERLQRSRDAARRAGAVIVLKGAHTAVCLPDGRVCFNNTGNPGLAKGGSGDVLTGLITGLCAQGLAPSSAAIVGVHLHGLAADITASELGWDGMLPSDVVARIPLAWKRIRAVA